MSAFKLPMDTIRPVIMVGAGTGLAPFRGFIQHREMLKQYGKLGPCVFIFGCRTKQDQICRQVSMSWFKSIMQPEQCLWSLAGSED